MLGTPLRVLVIEDSQEAADLLMFRLQQGDFDPVWKRVDNRSGLLAALEDEPWQVVILDYVMPEFTVREALEILRGRSLDPVIIVVSGRVGESFAVEVMRQGAHDFILKNNLARLVPAIHRELAEAARRREQRQVQFADELTTEIDHRILEGQDLDQLLPFICQRLCEIFALPLAWIGMKEENGAISIRAQAGVREHLRDFKLRWDETPEGRNLAALAIRSGKPRVGDPTLGLSVRGAAQEDKSKLKSAVVLPLKYKKETMGVLTLYSAESDRFQAAGLAQLTAFASRISVALLMAQDQRQLRLQRIALSNTANAAFITDLDGRIEWVNDSFATLSGYCAFEAIGKNANILDSGQHDPAFFQEIRDTLMKGVAWRGEIVERRKDASFYTVEQTISPLRDADGEITHFIAIQQDISERKQLETEIRRLAYHDPLTELPNRMLFRDRLQHGLAQARRNGQLLAVLFMDLDGFKDVNDSYGHVLGDQLLRLVALRVKGCVREGDTVARQGGDEFIFLLNDLSDPKNAAQVAQKVLDTLAQPFELDEHRPAVTASIGIAIYPTDGEDAEGLLKNADYAMYRAKIQNKNNYQFSTPEMNSNGHLRLVP